LTSLSDSAPRGLWRELWPVLAFVPFTTLMLFLDSRAVAGAGYDGQLLANLVVPAYLLLLTRAAPRDLRLMMVLIVPLSLAGEVLFSLLLDLYLYKVDQVPVYVPFGHAVVFSTGWLVSRTEAVERHGRAIQRALLPFYGLLLAGAVLWRGDTLSILLGLICALALWRKRAQPLYLIMGLLVLYVELAGTAFGCWAWQARPLGLFETTNPPVGAIVFYILGDMLTLRALRGARRLRARFRSLSGGIAQPAPTSGEEAG
jgi:hypothetical protein